jgi:hypothetical protein
MAAQPQQAEAFVTTAPLTVNAGQLGLTLSRDSFGHFAEHLGQRIVEGGWVGRPAGRVILTRYHNVFGTLNRVTGAGRVPDPSARLADVTVAQ